MPTDIKGVNTSPPRGNPRTLGRTIAIQPAETIRPGKYPNGQDRMGTPSGAERTDAKQQRYKDGATHRAALRSTPYPGK